VEYRRLGKTGLKVSAISLGSWLTFGAAVEREAAVATIHRAYDLGINFFDTANVYARGAAEEVVGEALRGLPRSSYVVATKVFGAMGDGPNDRGLSRKHIMEQCHASLRRLGLDYIDLYYCHRYDPETDPEETLRALDDLVTQGKVLYVGISEWTAAQIADAVYLARRLGLDPIAADQPVYNLLHRLIEAEIMPLCAREGIGLVPFSPLAQGVLTGKYRPGQAPPPGTRAADPDQGRWMQRLMSDPVLEAVQRLVPLAREHGLSPSQLALAWVLRRPEVSSALTGATRPEQVEENAKAAGVRLGDQVWAEVDRRLEGAVLVGPGQN